MRSTGSQQAAHDCLHLPSDGKEVYDLYRDTNSWYRVFDPTLADPAHFYNRRPGGANKVIANAISAAARFHRELHEYYHPGHGMLIDPISASAGREDRHVRQLSWPPGCITCLQHHGRAESDLAVLAGAPGQGRG